MSTAVLPVPGAGSRGTARRGLTTAVDRTDGSVHGTALDRALSGALILSLIHI